MLEVKEIKSRKEKNQFIHLPWKIYMKDQYWIPPLKRDIRLKMNQSKNPFFEYGSIKFFGVFNQSNEILGRVAVIINPKYNRIYDCESGFFGLFECINDMETATRLLEKAKVYLREQGFNKILGPVNFTLNDEAGLLIEGYNDSPMIMSNYCPDFYHKLLTANGFKKEIDLLSYLGYTNNIFPEKYNRIVKKVVENKSISIYHFIRKEYDQQVQIMTDIYNESFKDNWGFIPLSNDESIFMTKQFLPIADDKLIWFATCNNKPAGFILALPNINEILSILNGRLFRPSIFRFLSKKKNIKSFRVLVLGILPRYRGLGIESLLINQIKKRAYEKHYTISEYSMVLENNKSMIKVLERLGFKLIKRYRIFRAKI